MGVLYPATSVSGYNANPPPPVEPQIIYIEAEQGTPRLGHTDFDPLLRRNRCGGGEDVAYSKPSCAER
jgi:hypothetical protein